MSAKQSQGLTGLHVLAMLLLYFGAVIAINVAFAVAAVRTFPGEDERRSYTQGLHYNDTLATRRAQAAGGWQAEAQLGEGASGAQLVVVLLDRGDNPINDATVDGVLRRPPSQSGDRTLTFTPHGAGRYIAQLGALGAGSWDLRATARDQSGGSLDFEADLSWRSAH